MGSVSTDTGSSLAIKLSTRPEIVRVIRQALIAELDAANLYEQIAEGLPSKLSSLAELFQDIADEEKVHAGELLSALESIDPKEAKLQDEGQDEAEDIL